MTSPSKEWVNHGSGPRRWSYAPSPADPESEAVLSRNSCRPMPKPTSITRIPSAMTSWRRSSSEHKKARISDGSAWPDPEPDSVAERRGGGEDPVHLLRPVRQDRSHLDPRRGFSPRAAPSPIYMSVWGLGRCCR